MWQPCCKWHHDSVKQKLEWMYANGRASIGDLRLDSPKAVEVARGMADPS